MALEINISHWAEAAHFPVLTTLTLVPLLAMFAICYANSTKQALSFAFSGAVLNVLLSIYLLLVFNTTKTGIQLAEHFDLFGIHYRVGLDGVNILFIPLAAILTLLALIYTLITRHVTDKGFVASLLGYQGVLIGAFSALNVMQFWLWSCIELAPVIYLTLHAGTGQNRQQLVARLVQYWGIGLLMTFAGFLLLGLGLNDVGADSNFDWLTLVQNNGHLHHHTLIFILLFYGFAIRMPLFPFHGWLPVLAEQGTVASAAIFMVGLKLGIYAVIRFILPLLPQVAEQWADFVMLLGLISIFYGALLALMQINIRRLLAFAVLSHTGMLVIGLFSFNEHGLEGTILLSLTYGLATAGMLFSVGLIYERTRTAFIPRLGELFDTNTPIGLLFLISALSTIVMPGTPGFDAAHLLIEGTIEQHGWLVAIAILVGNVLAAAFLLWVFQRVFIAHSARAVKPYSSLHHPIFRERIIAVTISLLLIGTGFDTTPLLNFIDKKAASISRSYPKLEQQP
jgi:NADH-quinone oxidoreductase subunit M